MNIQDWMVILPVAVLMGWAVLLVLVDLWIPKERKYITALLSVVGLLITLGLSLAKWNAPEAAFGGMVQSDNFSVFLNGIFLVSGVAAIALTYDYMKRMDIERGEFYTLLLISLSGMMLMGNARNLLVVFLALELLSIPLYVLAAFWREQSISQEAGLKYFLIGAFSSGFVLYGSSLVFAGTGSLGFDEIVATITSGASAFPSLAIVGAALLLIGFSFKSAIVPFHMWAPDVYQGTPSPITAFMSVGAKTAGFAALARMLATLFPAFSAQLTPVLWVLAALTMIMGNVIALSQTNIKRLLAYSSIAQAGYLLMALVAFGNPDVVGQSAAALLFYLVAYTATSYGAWSVVIALEKQGNKGLELADYAGLGKKYPLWGVCMAIFMLSFTGVPITLGFWGKFYLFGTALRGGFTWLAVIGLLASVVSAFYYLKLVVAMFMKDGDPVLHENIWLKVTTWVTAAIVLGLGLIPWVIFDQAGQAILLTLIGK